MPLKGPPLMPLKDPSCAMHCPVSICVWTSYHKHEDTSIYQHGSSPWVGPACQQLCTALTAHGRHIEIVEFCCLPNELINVWRVDPCGLATWLLRLMQANVIITLIISQNYYEVWPLARWDRLYGGPSRIGNRQGCTLSSDTRSDTW